MPHLGYTYKLNNLQSKNKLNIQIYFNYIKFKMLETYNSVCEFH
jgi:hypothetical protein